MAKATVSTIGQSFVVDDRFKAEHIDYHEAMIKGLCSSDLFGGMFWQ